MTHREQIKEYLGNIQVDGLKIIDWGCGTKPVQRYMTQAINCEFTTVDVKSTDTIQPDFVVDMSNYRKASKQRFTKQFDMAFCIMVLEHVKKPRQAVHYILNSLKNEGKAVIAVPFLFPYHSEEDYWRFTEQGIRYLLELFPFEIDKIIPLVNDEGFIVEAHRKAYGDGR